MRPAAKRGHGPLTDQNDPKAEQESRSKRSGDRLSPPRKPERGFGGSAPSSKSPSLHGLDYLDKILSIDGTKIASPEKGGGGNKHDNAVSCLFTHRDFTSCRVKPGIPAQRASAGLGNDSFPVLVTIYCRQSTSNARQASITLDGSKTTKVPGKARPVAFLVLLQPCKTSVTNVNCHRFIVPTKARPDRGLPAPGFHRLSNRCSPTAHACFRNVPTAFETL